MQELIGQTLNRYRINSLLGEGGMGAVFKAEDLTLQRNVAVKVMHPHFARQENFRDRFLQEARTAARLDHPGIVQVYDFGQHQELLYIIMEFIPGENLQTMLRDLKAAGKWIRLDEAVHLIRLTATALDYTHNKGVLHRDLKPANIMLKPEPGDVLPYRPVITDLGLARLLEGTRLTQEGTSMGTPVYISPEQALGQNTDARSDVYSLGVLLFELVTGQPPFPVRTMADAIRYHVQTPPPKPRSLRPELPVDLEKAILFALEKTPAKRVPNAGAFADALKLIGPQVESFATATPTKIESVAISQAVSLMTQFEDQTGGRGVSILQEFAAPPDMSADRIQIMGKDKTTKSMVFQGGQMIVGRSETCQIQLPGNSISRQHARISFDGQRYQVTDLDSTNGTFLGNNRLLPGVAANWDPSQPLRMGDFWLKLILAGQATYKEGAESPTAAHPPLGSIAGTFTPSQPGTRAGSGRVGVAIEESSLTVEPGKSGAISVMLINQGAVVDHFRVAVDGVPENWVSLPPTLQLMPGGQQVVRIPISPERSPGSKAGRYTINVRVTSQDNPTEVGQASTAFTVAPFYRLSAEMYPQKIQTDRPARLTIHNQGNTREVYTVALRDRADELEFHPQDAQVQVPPGGSGSAEFRARLRKRYLLGANKTHPFSGTISTPQGETQSLSGEAISRPVIPVWMLSALVILCVVLTAAGGFYINEFNKQAAAATQAILATQTESARLAALVDTDGDGLTDEQERALGTTINSPDSDGDGLSDKEEVEGTTDPLNPDTDGDMLSDGDEKIWKTDPNAPDSDGDTIPDGEEVQVLMTSPINVDTDGDGLNDNVDPDPGHLPTLTPTATITLTPTPTENPTETITPSPTIPPDGVSLNCDGTYQRFNKLDGGLSGITLSIDNLVNGSWKPVWAINSGDPNQKQFEDETGLYPFGDCGQLLAVPIRFTGSGAVLQLVIYAWNGSTMELVYDQSGTGGIWEQQGDSVRMERSVYLYGEPNCCPCNREVLYHDWIEDEFVESAISLVPTYQGAPPAECQNPTVPVSTFVIPPPLITPFPISP